MGGNVEEAIARWTRVAMLVYVPTSAFAGLGMLAWLTFTDAGNRQPELYALVGGLIGHPVATLVLGARHRRSPETPEKTP